MTPRSIRLLFSLVLALPAGLPAQTFDGVRAQIRRQLVESGIPSISVAVARHGKILWEEGFGWADRDNAAQNNVVRYNEVHNVLSLMADGGGLTPS